GRSVTLAYGSLRSAAAGPVSFHSNHLLVSMLALKVSTSSRITRLTLSWQRGVPKTGPCQRYVSCTPTFPAGGPWRGQDYDAPHWKQTLFFRLGISALRAE